MSNDTLPEIRFPEFTDEWEQVKLKDVATVFDGTHQTPKYTESGVKFVSVENIKTLETEKYISQEAYDSEYSKKQAEKGDVLMTRIGDIGTAKVIETDEPLAYYVTLALLKPNEIDSSFLAWLISSPEVQRNIWKRTLHIAFPKKINLGEINQIEMNVPSLEEQTKIGTFFKQIDNTITLHQRKLDLLKETKKGFLQKMFPKNGAKVPEIRFPGFTEDWEERKLQEVLRERNNQQPQSTEYPLVSFTVENGVTPKTDRYEREQLVVGDKSSKKYKVTVLNDIVYNPANLKFGAISRNKYGNAVFSPIYITFLVNNDVTTPEFIEMFVTRNDFIKRALKYQQGTVYERQSVSPTDLLAMNVYLPGKSEQEKIGSFFQQLDETIALHQRKLDLLKETKKGFLQKMFV
ncbi:restriction endonuclease subunit S [Enterococcus hirae]|uniref:restriction endonuclease subunit S n=1 Tax=Enterococcus hirae TaxID=1354 RepID=UPI00295334F9|nr:restriction endonuclease subunit S [Enterococcus hirae]MDV7815865.1 restriction endonuclease subunit S [Enterococcus hirae]